MKNKFQKSVTKKYKKENKKPLIITGVGVDNWFYINVNILDYYRR